MAQLTYRDAVARGIAQEMRRDERVVARRRGRRRRGRRVQDDGRPARRVRPEAGHRHADLRAGDPRGGHGRRDDRAATGRRDHVLRLLRRLLGHRRQPDRQDALHDRRAGHPAARHQDRQRRRPALRRPALAVDRELGDGRSRAQGRDAVDPRGRRRADGRGHPRRRPGASSSSTRGCTPPRARCPTARSSTRLGTAKVRRPGTRRDDPGARHDGAARAGGGRGPGHPRHRRRGHRRALPRAARHAGRSSDRSPRPAGSSPWRRTRGCCGWGAEIASIVADEALLGPRRPGRSGSRRRTSRCRRPTPSRTSSCRRPRASPAPSRRRCSRERASDARPSTGASLAPDSPAGRRRRRRPSTRLTGTGPGGRVVAADVQRAGRGDHDGRRAAACRATADSLADAAPASASRHRRLHRGGRGRRDPACRAAGPVASSSSRRPSHALRACPRLNARHDGRTSSTTHARTPAVTGDADTGWSYARVISDAGDLNRRPRRAA